MEVEEEEHGCGCEDLKHVEPEVAAVDPEVDQQVVSLLFLFSLGVEEGVHWDIIMITGCSKKGRDGKGGRGR